MLNEFTYELIDEEAGLQPILTEAAYLKLTPALRAKYRIKDDDGPGSDEGVELKENDDELYLEHPEFEAEKELDTSGTLYDSPDYDEFEEMRSSRGGRVTRGYNKDDY